MFKVSTTVHVGNSSQALFWTDRWLDYSSITTLALDLLAAVGARCRGTQLVCEALQNDRWIADISGVLSVHALYQYVSTWSRLQGISLQQHVPDKFLWKWLANQ
jgi:hypothetical protein